MSDNSILFVDDRESQTIGVLTPLREGGKWKVTTCKTAEETLSRLEEMSLEGKLPSIVSLDLGLFPKPREPEIGINLLRNIHERWGGLPLIVHSVLEVKDSVLRTIISQGASYFWLFDEGDVNTYIELLPFIAQGYVIFSPTPSSRLPQVVTVMPDPFQKNPEIWKTLSYLTQGLTYVRIAEKEGVGDRAIMARVKKAALVLDALNEILLPPDSDDVTPERYKPYVIEWYKRNKVRFGY